MAPTPPPDAPTVKPEANDAGLVSLMVEAEDAIKVQIDKALNRINDQIIVPGVYAAVGEVVDSDWKAIVNATVDEKLIIIVDEVMKELPKMVSDAIDRALGEDGRSVLQQLARNTYTCALPCNCEPGCTYLSDGDLSQNRGSPVPGPNRGDGRG